MEIYIFCLRSFLCDSTRRKVPLISWKVLLAKILLYQKCSTLFQVHEINFLLLWEHLRISWDSVWLSCLFSTASVFCLLKDLILLSKMFYKNTASLVRMFYLNFTDTVSLPRRIHIFFVCVVCVIPLTDMYEV